MLRSNELNRLAFLHGHLYIYVCVCVFTLVQICWMHRFNEYSSCWSSWIVWFSFSFSLVAMFFNYILNSIQFSPNRKPNRYNPLDMKCVFSTATLWVDFFFGFFFGVYYLGFEWDARFICSVLDQRIILINSDRVLMHLVNLWECDEMVNGGMCVGPIKSFTVHFLSSLGTETFVSIFIDSLWCFFFFSFGWYTSPQPPNSIWPKLVFVFLSPLIRLLAEKLFELLTFSSQVESEILRPMC